MAVGDPRGRILLVAYHFPPAMSVGALRWEKLVHALVARGWSFDVLTLEPTQLARRDDSRLAALPPGVQVHGIRQDAPMAERVWNTLARVTKRFRSAAPSGHRRAEPVPTAVNSAPAAPAAARGGWRAAMNARLHVQNELGWVRRAVAQGRVLGRTHRYHAVITSGPPHFVHVAGRRLGDALGVPYLPDFRDPWGLAESIPLDMDSPTFHALTNRHERAVVERAAHIIMNTAAAAEAMRQRYPALGARITHLMNGSDREDYLPSPPRTRFTVSYAGSLYLQRDPRAMFAACAPVIREFALTPAQFAIEFLGPTDRYDGRLVTELAADYGVADHVIMRGMVPRRTALEAAAAATMLVCLPDGQRLTIPAKLFEFVQLDCWLLAFAEPGSAMAMALADTTADVVTPGDVEAAVRAVRARWLAFAGGEMPVAVDQGGRLARAAQAARLDEMLTALPAPRSATM
jgi:hypothetical protein